jgi:hypothetical protein
MLIPDHIIPIEELDPLPIADGDRRDFETIVASARSVAISFSRRDVEGRLLGRSPLVGDLSETYLSRGRTPRHAASEADRLLARPSEFQKTPIAVSGIACWRDWFRAEITAHDGLIGRAHPRLRKVFDRPMSATSLKLLRRRLESEREIEGLGFRRNGVNENAANADQVGGLNDTHCSVPHQGASEAVLLEVLFDREPPQHGYRHRVRHVAAQTSRGGFDSDRARGEGVIRDDTLLFAHNIGA